MYDCADDCAEACVSRSVNALQKLKDPKLRELMFSQCGRKQAWLKSDLLHFLYLKMFEKQLK